MGSYVVRIYHRERHENPPGLLGVVMAVEDETRHPFRTSEELWQILAALEGRSSQKTRRSEQEIVLSGVCLTKNSRATDLADTGENKSDSRSSRRAPRHH